MEIKRAIEFVIVLAPAIICLLIMALPMARKAFLACYSDLEAVNLAKEILAHATFYGPAVVVFFGYGKHSLAGLMAFAWFVTLTLLAYAMAVQARIIKKEKS